MWESSLETDYELYVSVSRENFPFCFAQRALAALRALALRCSAVSFLARALPPIRGTGSNRAEIYSSVLYARSTRDLDAGNNMPASD